MWFEDNYSGYSELGISLLIARSTSIDRRIAERQAYQISVMQKALQITSRRRW